MEILSSMGHSILQVTMHYVSLGKSRFSNSARFYEKREPGVRPDSH